MSGLDYLDPSFEPPPPAPPPPAPTNEVAKQGEASTQTLIEGPPTHVIWRDDGHELVHPEGYEDGEIEPLPDGFWTVPMVGDPATRTFAPAIEQMLATKLRAISDERDRRIERFHALQQTIVLDERTRAFLNGAALGLMRNPDLQSLSWSLGGGNFLVLPRDTVLAVADGGFLYVQGLFTKHKDLAAIAKAASDAGDLAAILAIDEKDDAAWVSEPAP